MTRPSMPPASMRPHQRGLTMLSVMLMTIALLTVGLLAVRSSVREVTYAGQLVARERATMAAQAAVDVAAAQYTTKTFDEITNDLGGYGSESCTDPCGDCLPGGNANILTGRRNDVLANISVSDLDERAGTIGCGGRPCMRQGAVARLTDASGITTDWCEVALRDVIEGADAEAQVTVWVRNNSADAIGQDGGDWATETDGRVVVTAMATVRNTTVTIEQEIQFQAGGTVDFVLPQSPDEGYGGGHNNDNTAVAVCTEEFLQVD